MFWEQILIIYRELALIFEYIGDFWRNGEVSASSSLKRENLLKAIKENNISIIFKDESWIKEKKKIFINILKPHDEKIIQKKTLVTFYGQKAMQLIPDIKKFLNIFIFKKEVFINNFIKMDYKNYDYKNDIDRVIRDMASIEEAREKFYLKKFYDYLYKIKKIMGNPSNVIEEPIKKDDNFIDIYEGISDDESSDYEHLSVYTEWELQPMVFHNKEFYYFIKPLEDELDYNIQNCPNFPDKFSEKMEKDFTLVKEKMYMNYLNYLDNLNIRNQNLNNPKKLALNFREFVYADIFSEEKYEKFIDSIETVQYFSHYNVELRNIKIKEGFRDYLSSVPIPLKSIDCLLKGVNDLIEKDVKNLFTELQNAYHVKIDSDNRYDIGLKECEDAFNAAKVIKIQFEDFVSEAKNAAKAADKAYMLIRPAEEAEGKAKEKLNQCLREYVRLKNNFDTAVKRSPYEVNRLVRKTKGWPENKAIPKYFNIPIKSVKGESKEKLMQNLNIKFVEAQISYWNIYGDMIKTKKDWLSAENYFNTEYSKDRHDALQKLHEESMDIYLFKKAKYEHMEKLNEKMRLNLGRFLRQYDVVEKLYVNKDKDK